MGRVDGDGLAGLGGRVAFDDRRGERRRRRYWNGLQQGQPEQQPQSSADDTGALPGLERQSQPRLGYNRRAFEDGLRTTLTWEMAQLGRMPSAGAPQRGG